MAIGKRSRRIARRRPDHAAAERLAAAQLVDPDVLRREKRREWETLIDKEASKKDDKEK